MSQRKAKTKPKGSAATPQQKPQAKPIFDVSQRLEKAVTEWTNSGKREPQLAAAVAALSAEIISLGSQDKSMLLNQTAVRAARQRVAAEPSDTYAPDDVDRAASVFSSSIMAAIA